MTILKNSRWAPTTTSTWQLVKLMLRCALEVTLSAKSGSRIGKTKKLKKTLLLSLEHNSACENHH